MELRLERGDLKPKCRLAKFENFKPEVQAAIIVVGFATYWERGDQSYNRIYSPPQAELERLQCVVAGHKIFGHPLEKR